MRRGLARVLRLVAPVVARPHDRSKHQPASEPEEQPMHCRMALIGATEKYPDLTAGDQEAQEAQRVLHDRDAFTPQIVVQPYR